MSEGRKIVDGKPGDQYTVQSGYEGRWNNAIGVPIDPRTQGSSVPVPHGTINSSTVHVTRPDFRSSGVAKDHPVFHKWILDYLDVEGFLSPGKCSGYGAFPAVPFGGGRCTESSLFMRADLGAPHRLALHHNAPKARLSLVGSLFCSLERQ
ncbi:hypothetical protein Ddc_11241 [Ditylenchus destructor]|nr:hypothetical protein Ddc_11241 [Ditylenchus destructor]